MTNPLASKAILASVTVHHWTGRRFDRQLSEEVNHQHGAEDEVVRTNKLLVPSHAFDDVYAAVRAGRRTHMEMTAPWLDSGQRVLPNILIDKFSSRVRDIRREFNEAADKFAKDYPEHLKNAPKRMGTAFKIEDYPDPKRVRSMFSFDVGLYNLTELPTGDVRLEIPKDFLKDSETQVKDAIENAMKEPVRRVITVVGKMAQKLKEYKPANKEKGLKAENTFRDSLVSNIKDLLDYLPAFNLTGDKALEGMINRMEKELCVVDADVLREDNLVRKKVAKAADDILKQAEAMMK